MKSGETVGVLKELSADERTRMLYEEREKARRDFQSRLDGGIRKKQCDIASNLLKLNIPIDTIVKAAGLTLTDVESLKKEIVK